MKKMKDSVFPAGSSLCRTLPLNPPRGTESYLLSIAVIIALYNKCHCVLLTSVSGPSLRLFNLSSAHTTWCETS